MFVFYCAKCERYVDPIDMQEFQYEGDWHWTCPICDSKLKEEIDLNID